MNTNIEQLETHKMNTKNTIYLTLGQAAQETGKSKGTISKDLKSGKISYVSKDKSGYKIDPIELFRVYPKGGPVNTNIEQLETHKNTSTDNELRHEMELLKKDIEHLREKANTLEEDRNHWRQQATNLLTDQRPKGSGWFDKLLGRD